MIHAEVIANLDERPLQGEGVMGTVSRLLSSLASVAFFLAMVPERGHADPVTAGLTIQPIDVCDLAGNCAVGLSDTTSFPNLQAVLSAVGAQAGIAPVVLPPEILPIQQTGIGATQVGLITGVDLNQPIDGFRLLTRLPQYNPSPYHNPNTINLYLVDTLSQPGQTVRGVSYVNGNGIILSNASEFDTGAHELSHNLGLDHTTFLNNPQDPNNVVSAGGIRISPGTTLDITPNGQNLDQLNMTQITRAEQPLFTVDLGRVVATPFTGDQPCLGQTCFNATYLAPPPSTTETLNSIQLKYEAGVMVNRFNFLPESNIDESHVHDTFMPLSGGVTQLTISFDPGTFGQSSCGSTTMLTNCMLDFGTAECEGEEFCRAVPNPVSVIFNFQDGFSSQAGYDAITGADSGFGSFGFVGTPHYYVPGTCPNDDCTMLPALFGSPPSLEHIDIDEVPVPEPSSLAALGAGLTCWWVVRRRRSSGWRTNSDRTN